MLKLQIVYYCWVQTKSPDNGLFESDISQDTSMDDERDRLHHMMDQLISAEDRVS